MLIEAELAPGRTRVLVNKQTPGPHPRPARLRSGSRVFAPDDLELVKGGPAQPPALPRRRARWRCTRATTRCGPRSRRCSGSATPCSRQVRRPARRVGRRSPSTCGTPSWRRRATSSAGCGWRCASGWRRRSPTAYAAVAVGAEARARVTSATSRRGTAARAGWPPRWRGPSRRPRGAPPPSGPHRDDLALAVGGLPARTHASQGEQRSLALALRLAAHAVVDRHGRHGAGAAARRRVLRARPRRVRRAAGVAARRARRCSPPPPGLPAGAEPERIARASPRSTTPTAACGPRSPRRRARSRPAGRSADAGGGRPTRSPRPAPATRDRAIRRRSGRCSTGCWPAWGPRRRRPSPPCSSGGTSSPGCRWPTTAYPVSLEAGVLVVKVDDPLWATEWRYRQGEVLRRCDEVLGGPASSPGSTSG